MVNNLKHWFFHLLNPHCPQCEELREMKNVCASCETLKLQLAIANDNNKELIRTITEMARDDKPQAQPVDTREMKPILPMHMPWSVRRQMLEANDRAAAQRLRQVEKEQKAPETTLEELEKEVLEVEKERLENVGEKLS